MDASAISDMLDLRLSSLTDGALDEYEKSQYMTLAQDNFYDAILGTFESTNLISEQIDSLIKDIAVTSFTPGKFTDILVDLGVYTRKVLRESVLLTNDKYTLSPLKGATLEVTEERLSEIQNSLKNPFRKPGEFSVLRTVAASQKFNKVSLYLPANSKLSTYSATVAVEPEPIILTPLTDGLNIRGKQEVTTTFEFKDKDIEKIIEIAVSLVLRDRVAGSPPQQVAQPQ